MVTINVEGALSATGWVIWALRTIVAWGGSAIVAFLVSDYVVESRTASLDTALSSMDNSLTRGLDTLNVTMQGVQSSLSSIDRKMEANGEKFTSVQIATELNNQRIEQLQAQIEETQASINETSGEIKTAVESGWTALNSGGSLDDARWIRAIEGLELVPKQDGEGFRLINKGQESEGAPSPDERGPELQLSPSGSENSFEFYSPNNDATETPSLPE